MNQFSQTRIVKSVGLLAMLLVAFWGLQSTWGVNEKASEFLSPDDGTQRFSNTYLQYPDGTISGYHVEGERVFWDAELVSNDVQHFRALGYSIKPGGSDHYGVDSTNVYWFAHKINKADPTTFTVLPRFLPCKAPAGEILPCYFDAMDMNHVYTNGFLVEETVGG